MSKIQFEIRRKFIHVLLGIFILSLIYFDLFSFPIWILILIFGIFLSFLLKKYKIPYFTDFIFSFSKEEEIKKFPLKGVLAFLFGSGLTFVLFSKFIAIFAIITLIVGDSIASLYGIFFGKIKNPFCQEKHLDASLIGMVASFIAIYTVWILKAGWIVFPFFKVFLAVFFALLTEGFTSSQKMSSSFPNFLLDDNVFVPLICGLFLWLTL